MLNLWLWKLHRPEHTIKVGDMPRLDQLRRSEWSNDFERLCRNRLLQGAFRYGRVGGKNKPKFNRMQKAFDLLERYQSEGNDELLVDVANLCQLEFVEGRHPKKHFVSEDDIDHVQVKE